jgi:hypothetical protein
MGSSVSSFETEIKIRIANRDGTGFAIGYESDRANDVSSPDFQGLERVLGLLIELKIH